MDSLTAQIEGLWRDINASTPHWLNQVTLDIVGQIRRDELNQERERLQRRRKEAEELERKKREAERRKTEELERKKREAECLKLLEAIQEKARLAEEQKKKKEQEKRIAIEQQRQARLQSNAFKIQKICEMYGIQALVHFTHIRNLHSILLHGLRGRPQLESMSWVKPPQYNDSLRRDGYPQAICLSISFPNYQMFYKYRCENPPASNWVVLLLKPSILWELECKFFWENAASNNVKENSREILTEARKQPDALIRMFGDYKDIQRQDLDIPSNFTTHPQAEVLVFDAISPQYIDVVHFDSLDSGQQWVSQNPGNYSQKFYGGDSYYFSYREDWEMWKPK